MTNKQKRRAAIRLIIYGSVILLFGVLLLIPLLMYASYKSITLYISSFVMVVTGAAFIWIAIINLRKANKAIKDSIGDDEKPHMITGGIAFMGLVLWWDSISTVLAAVIIYSKLGYDTSLLYTILFAISEPFLIIMLVMYHQKRM